MNNKVRYVVYVTFKTVIDGCPAAQVIRQLTCSQMAAPRFVANLKQLQRRHWMYGQSCLSVSAHFSMSHPNNLNGIIDALGHHVVPNEISISFRKMCRPDTRTISGSAMSFPSLLLAVLGQSPCVSVARHGIQIQKYSPTDWKGGIRTVSVTCLPKSDC